MLKVNGQVYVTNLKEVSPRLITGTVYSFEKVGDGLRGSSNSVFDFSVCQYLLNGKGNMGYSWKNTVPFCIR